MRGQGHNHLYVSVLGKRKLLNITDTFVLQSLECLDTPPRGLQAGAEGVGQVSDLLCLSFICTQNGSSSFPERVLWEHTQHFQRPAQGSAPHP